MTCVLCTQVSPPSSFMEILTDPLHSFCYVFFVLFVCAQFSVRSPQPRILIANDWCWAAVRVRVSH